MPLFIAFVALLLLVAGINNKVDDLGALIKSSTKPSDGSPSFLGWGFGLFIVGALGYYKPLKGLSNAFLVLIFVGLLLSNEGFFNKVTEAFRGLPKATPPLSQGSRR